MLRKPRGLLDETDRPARTDVFDHGRNEKVDESVRQAFERNDRRHDRQGG